MWKFLAAVMLVTTLNTENIGAGVGNGLMGDRGGNSLGHGGGNG